MRCQPRQDAMRWACQLFNVFREDMASHHFHLMYISMDQCRLSVSFPGYEDEESVVVLRKSEGFPDKAPVCVSRKKWDGTYRPRVHPLAMAVLWARSKDMQTFLRSFCLVIRGVTRRSYERAVHTALTTRSPLPLDIIREIVTYLYD